MRILALDLARNTGWVVGEAGKPEFYGRKVLRSADMAIPVGVGQLGIELERWFDKYAPDLVVCEAAVMPFERQGPPQPGQGQMQRNMQSVVQAFQLYGCVVGVCGARGITVRSVASQSWRKHFLGRPNFGDKLKTKLKTVEQCKLVGYIPKDAVITNKNADKLFDICDAFGIFDWASVHLARVTPRELFLQGERPR